MQHKNAKHPKPNGDKAPQSPSKTPKEKPKEKHKEKNKEPKLKHKCLGTRKIDFPHI